MDCAVRLICSRAVRDSKFCGMLQDRKEISNPMYTSEQKVESSKQKNTYYLELKLVKCLIVYLQAPSKVQWSGTGCYLRQESESRDWELFITVGYWEELKLQRHQMREREGIWDQKRDLGSEIEVPKGQVTNKKAKST